MAHDAVPGRTPGAGAGEIAEDRRLRRRLELRAAAAHSDIDTVGDRILALIDPRPFIRYGYLEYADASGHAQQVAEAAAALRALTTDGQGVLAWGVGWWVIQQAAM